MKQYILTEEQFAFMKKHHDQIEYSMVYSEPGKHDFIDDLEASDEYKAVFGDMLWDDAYDRYEDTPGYDRSLKLELKAKLAAASGENSDSNSTIDDTDDLFLAEQLIRLRDQNRKKVQ
jgi:hypothetical protein